MSDYFKKQQALNQQKNALVYAYYKEGNSYNRTSIHFNLSTSKVRSIVQRYTKYEMEGKNITPLTDTELNKRTWSEIESLVCAWYSTNEPLEEIAKEAEITVEQVLQIAQKYHVEVLDAFK